LFLNLGALGIVHSNHPVYKQGDSKTQASLVYYIVQEVVLNFVFPDYNFQVQVHALPNAPKQTQHSQRQVHFHRAFSNLETLSLIFFYSLKQPQRQSPKEMAIITTTTTKMTNNFFSARYVELVTKITPFTRSHLIFNFEPINFELFNLNLVC
jgi:hypothetical protein